MGVTLRYEICSVRVLIIRIDPSHYSRVDHCQNAHHLPSLNKIMFIKFRTMIKYYF